MVLAYEHDLQVGQVSSPIMIKKTRPQSGSAMWWRHFDYTEAEPIRHHAFPQSAAERAIRCRISARLPNPCSTPACRDLPPLVSGEWGAASAQGLKQHYRESRTSRARVADRRPGG